MKQEIKEWEIDYKAEGTAHDQLKAWLENLMETHVIVSVVTTDTCSFHEDVQIGNTHPENAIAIVIDKKSYNS